MTLSNYVRNYDLTRCVVIKSLGRRHLYLKSSETMETCVNTLPMRHHGSDIDTSSRLGTDYILSVETKV